MAGCLRKSTVGRLCRIALVCVLAGCGSVWLALPGPASGKSSARQASSPPLGGINIGGLYTGAQPSDASREVVTAHALHAQLVRIQVPWAVLEPRASNHPEPRALAFLDQLVADASADGIKVIMTLTSTPCWASSAPTSLMSRCAPGTLTKANAWPPRRASDFGDVAGYIAERYGSDLAAIEIWNEPDQINQIYFAGPEKPKQYAAMLRAAYPAIKRANPAIAVLAGSLVGSNGVFLRALYAAGIKGYYDGLAVHFYTLVLGSLRAIHETQLANADNTPLWLDEFGWSSCWPKRKLEQEQGCVTRKVQASNLTNTFKALAHTPYVAAEVVYKLQDSTAEAFGAITEGGAHKRSFAALSRMFRSPFGKQSRVTLHVHRHRGRLMASGSGPAGDYLQLEVLHGAVPRYRAFFTLNRFNRYTLALPKVLGTRGLQVRVFQYWSGSATAAHALA